MAANKDVYELKCKQTFQLSWKLDFSVVALQNVGETSLLLDLEEDD